MSAVSDTAVLIVLPSLNIELIAPVLEKDVGNRSDSEEYSSHYRK
jgi:hypothetical protein